MDKDKLSLKRVVDAQTDQLPAISQNTETKLKAVSYDMCARVNALIDPRWSTVTLFCKVRNYYARVKQVVPSKNPGFIIVACDSIHGHEIVEVGAGIAFDLRFQVT